MTDTFRAELLARLGWKRTSGSVTDEQQCKYCQPLECGDGPGQAEAAWQDADAFLLDGAARPLDLTALTRPMFDDLHTTVLVTVRAILLVNNNVAQGRLVVGRAAQHEWFAPFSAAGGMLEVPPQSAALVSNRQAGWAVDAARRNLKLAAVGGDVSYSIAILGTLTAGGSGSSSGW
jgi:hypothetical protein